MIAYLPPLIRVCRDPNGAKAVSVAIWTLFASANLATFGYALSVWGDALTASLFALNAFGCAAIVAFTIGKRFWLWRRKFNESPIGAEIAGRRSVVPHRERPRIVQPHSIAVHPTPAEHHV